MGLSNEERVRGFLGSTSRLRCCLVDLRDTPMDIKYLREEHAKVVQPLIEELDAVVGLYLWNAEADGMFWILGHKEGSLRDTVLPLDSSDAREPPSQMEEERGSIHWWWLKASADDVINVWTSTPFIEDRTGLIRSIARWWSAWGNIGLIRYYVSRYDDDLFSPDLRRRLMVLVGRLHAARDALARSGVVSNPERWYSVERSYLCRTDLVAIRLAAESRKVDSRHKPGGKKLPPSFKASSRGRDVVVEVGKMPLFQVLEALDEEKEKVYRDEQNYDASRHVGEEQFHGVDGPTMRTQDVLEAFVQGVGGDPIEVEAARAELRARFGIYVPPPPSTLQPRVRRSRSKTARTGPKTR